MKQFEAIVTGRVQGVSFRYYTRQEALRLGAVGWVANQRDGSVKVAAQGTDEALSNLIDFLHHGPAMARVDKVEVTWTEGTKAFQKFSVRWI